MPTFIDTFGQGIDKNAKYTKWSQGSTMQWTPYVLSVESFDDWKDNSIKLSMYSNYRQQNITFDEKSNKLIRIVSDFKDKAKIIKNQYDPRKLVLHCGRKNKIYEIVGTGKETYSGIVKVKIKEVMEYKDGKLVEVQTEKSTTVDGDKCRQVYVFDDKAVALSDKKITNEWILQ